MTALLKKMELETKDQPWMRGCAPYKYVVVCLLLHLLGIRILYYYVSYCIASFLVRNPTVSFHVGQVSRVSLSLPRVSSSSLSRISLCSFFWIGSTSYEFPCTQEEDVGLGRTSSKSKLMAPVRSLAKRPTQGLRVGQKGKSLSLEESTD